MPAPESRKLVKTRHPGIFKRGSRYVVVYRDGGGKQRKEAARTLDDARSLQAKRKTQVDRGELQELSKVTFGEYALEWIDRYQGNGRRGFRDLTREEYRRDLGRYAIPHLGHLRLIALTPRHIADFIAWLCDGDEQGRRVALERREVKAAKRGVLPHTLPLSPLPFVLADQTVRRILAPVRSCLGTAEQHGDIRSNPTRGAALPRRDWIEEDPEHEDIRALTREQLDAFLRVVHSRYRLLFKLLAATGLRVSEAFALQWQHLHLDGSEPHVKVRRAHVKGRFGPPKSKHGRRNVPLSNLLVNDFRQWRTDTEWPRDEDLVFPALNGRPLRQENVRRRALKPAAEEAGVPWMGFHTLRHGCASMLFERGRNAVQVQRWLGHHSPAFTLATYCHLLSDSLGDALDVAPEPLAPTGTTGPSAVIEAAPEPAWAT